MAWGTGAYTVEEVRYSMQSGDVYIAMLDSKAVGTFRLQWTDDIIWDGPENAGYIHQLAVMEGFHGQDLGAHLIDWASKKVAKHNKQFLRLDCPSANQKLCAYYERQGFVQVGLKSIPSFNNYTAALYERKVS